MLLLLFAAQSENAQDAVTTIATDQSAIAPVKKGVDSSWKYRLLQSNSFLVETAYLQEETELQHNFTFLRSKGGKWSMVFSEEIPLASDRHQLSFSMPAELVATGTDGYRGTGDIKIGYNYGLIGDGASRVTVSPGIGISLPTGSYKKELGAGGPGVSVTVPVSVMLAKRFASNSSFEATYTRSAKNKDGERASTVSYEVGQSFVWFAKPKLNFLVEAVWERSQAVSGMNARENEYEMLVSPGVRWAHVFKNGLIVSPGVAVPIGIGPSRGERGLFFYIAFEHPFKKEIE